MLDRIGIDSSVMIDAALRAGWDAPVPGLTWSVRDVVIHTGAVHRWAADVVRRALPTNETGGSRAFRPDGLPDEDVPAWFAEGAADLSAALRSAPSDLACFTFITGVPAHEFWVRRQAHETAIHRADVELAAGGPVTAVAPGFAQDGLAEIVGGFATERGFATSYAGRLLLDATDGPAWLVVFGGERTITRPDVPASTPADAVVRGTSDALYRWAWNRPVPEAEERGDPQTLACWRSVRIP